MIRSLSLHEGGRQLGPSLDRRLLPSLGRPLDLRFHLHRNLRREFLSRLTLLSGCALALAFVLALVLALALAAPAARASFVESLAFGGGATIALAWADADGDGDLDMAVGRYQQTNHLYLRNPDGTYTESSPFGSGATFAVAWADFDADGDEDIAVGRGNNQQNYLYVNNGDGTWTQRNEFGTRRTISTAWADFDLDGDLDLAVANGILGVAEQNYLYVDNGDGTFTERPEFGAGQTCTLVWGDFDGDGDPDVAVGNGGFGYVEQNFLYVNNGDGTFTGRPEFGALDTASMDWGDADNDGDLDLAVGNWNLGPSSLYVNNGDGTFTGRPEFGARDTNTLSWGDADGDGDLDVAVGNGDFTSADQNYLYVNDGTGHFTEVPAFGMGSTDAVVWADADGDGDLDLAAGNEHSPGTNYLYLNDLDPASEGWISFHLVGHRHDQGSGYSNRDGIGARVTVYRAGHIGDPAFRIGMREIEAHGGFSAQDAIDAHFGIPGGAATVDVRIVWPGSGGTGIVQDLPGQPTGQRHRIDEARPGAGVEEPAHGSLGGPASIRAFPNPMIGETRIDASLPGNPSGASTALAVFDATGRQVRRLAGAARSEAAGASIEAIWDGRDDRGRLVVAGVYLVRPATGSGPSARILLLH
ncbi:MAG: FG-GAP-like repeat-containing protein [Candidatus Eisenbacteria bacterium]